ncbi:MAG: nucleotidyl transferase AbiEii/AbiGii toxin family protein [Acidobacteriota bacterium]|nr:nucleotidyl transferase AbiEii/AbiGii toxin family protein [Acidobacteriota bacterium]
MKEALPLATIQNAVIDFLRGRDDVALFGAQAVNVYVNEPRATQDVDLMSTRAADLAEELRDHLSRLFHVAVRVREIKDGLGYRIFQLQKTGNRHLVDVRSVASLPPIQIIEDIQVLPPAELIASKVISHHQRRGKSKSWTDRRDLVVLLLAFPDLKSDPNPVKECLLKAQANPEVLRLWHELATQELEPETDEDDF